MAPAADNKDDDDFKIQSSSKAGRPFAIARNVVENHKPAAATREKPPDADRDFALIRSAYEKATGNRWRKSDTEAYEENSLSAIPAERIISVLEAVTRRTPTKINSFRYFIKEIVAFPDPRNRAWQKKQLGNIVSRIRDNSVGRTKYSSIDFREDVKCACARDSVVFDDDMYDELVG